MMNFTIDVRVTGLEGIVSILEKLVSVNPSNTGFAPAQAPVVNPAPAMVQTVAPVTTPAVQTYAQPQPPQMASVPVMQAPVQPPVTPAPAVPTVGATYSIEQLAVAATQLVDGGRRNDLVQLLASFGVQALTDLPKDHYGAFVTHLRGMGARI